MPSLHKKSFAAEQLARQKKTNPVVWVLVGVVVVLLVVGVYVIYSRSVVQKQAETGAQQIKSIAVLPLDNQSGDPEQEYFTDGMQDALINNLYKISALRVIPRTSVMRYRDTDKTISEIARELEVDAVIEGSVLRVENKVRITVQLVGAEPERHIWANDYTRDLHDIIALQNEVAQAIAGEIKITVTPEEEKLLVSSYTVNPEAYDYFLRGNDYYHRSYDEEEMRIAIQMYKKAVELDTTFATAYAKYAQTQLRMYWYYYDRSEECLTEAKKAVDKALQLNPELPEAYLALGIYYYWGHLDYESALEQFAIARISQPNNIDLLVSIGYVQRRQGKFEEALANIRKGSGLDPLSPVLATQVGLTYDLLRNYPEAERYYDRAISLAPDITSSINRKALLYLRWEGKTEKVRAVLEESPLNIDSAENPFINTFIPLDVYDGNYQEALDRLSSKPEDIDNLNSFIPVVLRYAYIYRYMNNKELAQAYYDSARVILENKIKEQPEDERFHGALGIAYAGLCSKEEAIREGKLAMELLPVSRHKAWKGLTRVEEMARIYVMVGEYDRAIDQLEFLLSRPGYMTVHLLRLDPIWDPLRDNPRFQKLLDTYDITDE